MWAEAPPLVVIGHNPSMAGQLKCPSCKTWVVPVRGVHQRCADGHTFERPDDGSDDKDDPTIRRCIGFAQSIGAGGLLMLNLCAWIDTDPNGLTSLEDPIGHPRNNEAILEACSRAMMVVAAWGSLAAKSKNQMVRGQPRDVLRMLTSKSWGGLGLDVHAFRITKDGHPSHPLYLPKSLVPVLYREAVP